VTKSGLPLDRRVCDYCGLESAVSHATARECIDVLQREANRLKNQMLHGRSDKAAAAERPLESGARRVVERDRDRAWSPAGARGRPVAPVSLSLPDARR
jgi:hypothetical protein